MENPNKTENPAFYAKQGMTAAQTQGLSDVIGYASQTSKTQLSNEHNEIMLRFVTGINCQPETAREEMMAVKKRYGKTEGVVAYHGYQSFAPGEATPEIAHEIGIKLAEKLWGDRFQVIVATHLDKENHLHSHFVLNNVSMVDGKKYYRSKHDYWLMQQESDKLCREYGLSVIEEKSGQSKHYGEWKAEQEGRPTWRSLIKVDVDTAIRQSMTERQFFINLQKMGYEIKAGKDISVRPPGKERFVRLYRNFGDEYTIDGIRKRILAQTRPERLIIPSSPPPKKIHYKGSWHNSRKITGLRALYFYYLYRMGAIPKKREPNPKQVYFLFREDIRFIQNISRETRLLVKHGIDTAEQLIAHKDRLAAQINLLYNQRKDLRKQIRGIGDEGKLAAVKTEITALSEQMGELRREVRLCDDIEKRSAEMRDKIRRAVEDGKSQVKERSNHEHFRRCR
ncbi:MAG: relaxase/mobilization nuclease domain-containing protein [Clostridiales bacterium]|nr:relaxase/mobilization nuclease domain-containing protein [Clostridiales bacterium]